MRFLQVTSGGIPGIKEWRFLAPVDASLWMDDHQVIMDPSGKRVSGSPDDDPGIAFDLAPYNALAS